MLRHLRAWASRLVGSVRSARRDDDLSNELASHVQLHVDDNLRAGMAPDEARRQALLKLGGVAQTSEAHRDRAGLPWLDSIGRDVKYAIRFLRRSPGFTAVAILSLALGIGANTAIFSLVDALLLRSLPVKQPDRLVQLSGTGEGDFWSYPLWQQIQDRADLFDGTCAWAARRFNLASSGEAHFADGLLVSGAFFSVLGVQPVLGRAIQERDDEPGGGPDGPVAVISDDFWQAQFSGAPNVLGRRLTLNGTAFTIVGVMPPGFAGPSPGSRFDVAVPLTTASYLHLVNADLLIERASWWLQIMARLKPGTTAAATAAALRAAQPAIRQATLPVREFQPEEIARYLKDPLVVRPAPAGADSYLREQYRLPLLALMTVVGLVLLIACVNLANLLLARADARRHELGIRLALGASRGQLVRQLLMESLLLSGVGAVFGGLLAIWGSRLLMAQIEIARQPMFLDLSPNIQVLAFTGAVAVAVGLLFGTAPALRATSIGPSAAFAERGQQAAGAVRWRLGTMLMIVQVGLSLVLAVGAGLFVRTFTMLASERLGFTPDRVLTANLEDVAPSGLSQIDRHAVLDAVRAAPGVRSAAMSYTVPLNHMGWADFLESPDGVSLPRAARHAWRNAVSPGWFGTMGTPVIAGRDFSRRDTAGSVLVAIVNEALVHQMFPDGHAIGRTVRFLSRPGTRERALTIVGIVADAVYRSQRQGAPPTLYVPLAQAPEEEARSPVLIIRSAAGPPSVLTDEVASAISRADPHLFFTFQTLSGLVDESLSTERVLAMLAGFFGALALLLAAIGLYGVVSYNVNRRRTEIGIRMALGARPGGIVRMVLERIGVTMAIGLTVGGVASVWLAHFVKSLLYGLQPDDPITLAGAIVVLAGVGLLASWLAARRAARIDPMEALREN